MAYHVHDKIPLLPPKHADGNLVESTPWEKITGVSSALQAAYDKANRLRMEAEDQLRDARKCIKHQEVEIEILKAALTALKSGWKIKTWDDQSDTKCIMVDYSDYRSSWCACWIPVIPGLVVPDWIKRECNDGFLSKEEVLERGE